MLDQTFSAKNFHTISEIEKRRGRVPDLKFFPEVTKKTEILKERIEDCKDFRRNQIGKYSDGDQAIFNHLRDMREAARDKRDEQLLKCLEVVAKNVSKKSYSIDFEKLAGPGGKPVYQIKKDVPEHHYAEKQISRNLSKLYKVKQSNRNQIVSQLSNILMDEFPYHFIRTDISSFYESINHAALVQKLRDDQLLSQTALRLTRNMLEKFSRLTGTPGMGLPRGIGLSAYLAELYMRDFDEAVRGIEDVVYSARYVDDIVIIFAPTPMSKPKEYMPQIESEMSKKGLVRNTIKTEESKFEADGTSRGRSGLKFEYLGYEFNFEPKPIIRLSASKNAKYEARLNASFSRYYADKTTNSRKAYRLLLKRIRFLTGNTQLTHNKQNAFVGIYFGNPHLTDTQQLKNLDHKLTNLISKVPSASLKAKLGTLSFVDGYEQRIFRRFHRKGDFGKITEAWKYE
ncbi:antiviral reverse transcriptase Drt3a [Pacificibacter marinus]|uniref:Reverse transcriptase (RNA-dependent DNA polymerase) n=1 Tax=Pacificibacter marinus TaxID=658057 RepID=A0A1Y5TRJ6_9RHOB|nr:antiviral reverse transcriptase Drt3a [Pacificibacter marinus]SEL39937.1 Reverse transcriptase (RNA-dependent DNA polymerase) [Pacificibacter marinus]SLN70311.1 Reverse transcriptase (RNA-dependent DNA polymerase) [Pacificibacter marinus]